MKTFYFNCCLLFTFNFLVLGVQLGQSQNTYYGIGAGSGGSGNSHFGYEAGRVSTGGNNAFFGQKAGYNNTTGGQNLFLGITTGYNSTTGANNVYAGYKAGFSGSSASENVLVGYKAGYTNTLGKNHVIIGYNAGYYNTNGHNNTFIGMQSGYLNTTGSSNIFIGKYAGYANTTQDLNIFIGYSAGYFNKGLANTFIGIEAGRVNTTGGYNSFQGFLSGTSNTIGIGNSFYGSLSGQSNTSGDRNTFTGFSSGYKNTTGNSNTFSGNYSGFNTTSGSKNTFYGDSSGLANTTGTRNTFIGYHASGSGSLTNSTAIGNTASVSSNNAIVLGNNAVTKWGFGVTPAISNILQFFNTTAKLTTGGVWTNASDQAIKENIQKVDGKEVLKKLEQLEITRWNYKVEDKSIQHIGPMAQDFYRLFNTGGDDKTISTIDPAGVALAAIKELHQLNGVLAAENRELKAEINQLKETLGKSDAKHLQAEAELKSAMAQILIKMQQLESCLPCPQTSAISPVPVNGSDRNDEVARLEQNEPNPFSGQTLIRFFLPRYVGSASLRIYDMSGNLVHAQQLEGRGAGQYSLKSGSLADGLYTCTLVTDNSLAATIKMVLSAR